MPIVINEVVVNVSTENSSGSRGATTESANGGTQQIIRECVEKVLEILKEKQER